MQPLDKERVREWRNRRMLSQQEVADRAGTSLFTIQRIERGEGNVRPKTGRGVAAALGVEVEELLPKAQSPLPLDYGTYGTEERTRAASERLSELSQESRDTFKAAIERATEDVGPRINKYQDWLDFVNRYAGRWEQRIEAGDFNMADVNEFIATLEDLGPTLNRLGLQEKREQPAGYMFTFGPIMGEAIQRLMDLLNPLIEAGVAKFDNSEIEQLRRKRAEQEAALGEPVRRGA